MVTQNLTRINVPLARDEAQMILELARKEFRHPREQARLLVCEALRARGLLTDASAQSTRQTDAARAEGVKYAANN